MKIQTYDILSQVIPGYIILAVLTYYYPAYSPELEILPSLGIAYFIGYFLNILSSLFERIYYQIWGGIPSTQILEGRSFGKIKLSEREAIREELITHIKLENPSNSALFSKAMQVAVNSENDRVQTFNENYAFSRSLLTCMIIITFLLLSKYYAYWQVYPIVLIFLWLCNFRAKQRGFYFAKEVLVTYWYERKEKSNTEKANSEAQKP